MLPELAAWLQATGLLLVALARLPIAPTIAGVAVAVWIIATAKPRTIGTLVRSVMVGFLVVLCALGIQQYFLSVR